MINEFEFVGLTNNPVQQIVLFLVFLIFYVATLVGNLGMITLVVISPRLHTPMYFFLSNLSLLDICFSSVVTPKFLANLLSKKRAISFLGCAIQMYFVIGLASVECFLLAAMAYDRYTAICKPLLYPVLMSPKVCILLVTSSYILGLLHSLLHTLFTFQLSFCQSSELNQLYCDITALLSLSCSDTSVNELLIFYVAGLVEATTLLSVLVSYVSILASLRKIRSATGRLKAFSTCTSHLTAVAIFHGAILILHFRPKPSGGSFAQDMHLLYAKLQISPSMERILNLSQMQSIGHKPIGLGFKFCLNINCARPCGTQLLRDTTWRIPMQLILVKWKPQH